MKEVKVGTLVLAWLAVALSCAPVSEESHSLSITNKTDGAIERLGVDLGDRQIGLGNLAPGVQAMAIVSGPLPEAVVIRWRADGEDCEANITTDQIPDGFEGTIVIGLEGDGRATVVLEEPIPLPQSR